MRLSVRTKILATSGLLLLASLIVTVVAVVSLSSVNDQAELSYSHGTAAVRALAVIDAAIGEKQAALNESVFIGNATEAQAQLDQVINADDKEIAEALATYEAIPHSSQEANDLAALKAAMTPYTAAFTQALADAKAGGQRAGREAILVQSQHDQMAAALDKLQTAAEADALAIKAQTHRIGGDAVRDGPGPGRTRRSLPPPGRRSGELRQCNPRPPRQRLAGSIESSGRIGITQSMAGSLSPQAAQPTPRAERFRAGKTRAVCSRHASQT
jgi:hypothetical protein